MGKQKFVLELKAETKISSNHLKDYFKGNDEFWKIFGIKYLQVSASE